jgi:hypothetical protein
VLKLKEEVSKEPRVVIETIKGMISNKYNVRLLNGEILNINQNEILPK